MGPEIYPMPSFPTLAVADAAASARWDRALGFASIFEMPGPNGPTLVHLRWARYADLLLRPEREVPHPRGAGITLNFTVAEGAVDAVADRARAMGVSLVQEPGNRPWNARDFTVSDPDGYRLTFAKGPVEKDPSFERVMARAAAHR